MKFWTKQTLSKLSGLFVQKYEETEEYEWNDFLKRAGCEVVSVEGVNEMCDIINLRSDLEKFVAIGCENDCEIILVPKDLAVTAVVLNGMPDVSGGF
jgi:hypothetical protein